jgi:BirA family transcriptional regulator, biotin operon repressor / biotin---[acetyl-CoA-carboxylase] ligase
MPDDELAAAVAALPPHWQAHYFAAVDSTQDEARAASRSTRVVDQHRAGLASAADVVNQDHGAVAGAADAVPGQLGAPHRSIFVADYQRAGRGRQGRAWLAPPGVALMLSIVFRDPAATPIPWRWTSLASVALAEAIEDILPGLRPAIKWPNDVLLNDRKVAGILAETSWDGLELVAIVGVGVNVRTPPADLARLGGAATSLRVASGQDVDSGRLLTAFVRRIDIWLARPPEDRHAAWQSRLWGRGQRLRLSDLGRDEEVVVLGAEPDGSLRVRLSDGSERRTTTGELIL